MNNIIIEFTIQINKETNYEVRIFTNRLFQNKYLEGNYKIEHASVKIKK